MKNRNTSTRKLIKSILNWIVILSLWILIASCSSPATASTSNVVSRCVPASALQMQAIQDGVEDIEKNNSIKTGWAVKSNDFQKVWMVAAKIYGQGMENGTGPGVWAISGDLDNPGMVLSVDGFAKEFSPWPDASKTDAAITIGADGVAEAKQCANNE